MTLYRVFIQGLSVQKIENVTVDKDGKRWYFNGLRQAHIKSDYFGKIFDTEDEAKNHLRETIDLRIQGLQNEIDYLKGVLRGIE